MKYKTPAMTQLRKVLEDQQVAAFQQALDAVPKVDTSDVAAKEFEWSLNRVMELDAQQARFANIHVTEPDLYRPGSEHSFFADMASVASHSAGMFAARERLQRHTDQAAGHLEVRGASQVFQGQSRGVIFPAEVQERALSLTSGQGGEFSPPAFMLDEFASIARSASPVLRALPSTPLPPNCFEVFIPRVASAGGVVAMPTTENVNPPTTWSSTDQLLIPVVMFAGEVPLSQQLFERGPNIDRYLTSDFAEAAAAAMEQQVITGTGTGGQMLGLVNLSTSTVDGVPGANLVTWTQAAPTPVGLTGQMGAAFAEIGNTRLRPPSHAIMTPERYAWMVANKDANGEPNMRPGTGLVPSNADEGERGPIAGLPVLLSGEVPQTLGAGANQDTVIEIRAADLLFLPSDPIFAAVIAEGASSMTVVATWHCYAAFTAARYPSSVATIQGTGLVRSGPALTWPS